MIRKASRAIENAPTWGVLGWIGVLMIAALLGRAFAGHETKMTWALAIFLAASVAIMGRIPQLPPVLRLLLVAAALLNGAGGAFDWFNAFVWYDELVHTYTGFAGLFAIGYLYARDREAVRTHLVRWCIGMGLTLGIGWEVVEGLGGDLEFWDTVSDILLDTIGAGLGGIAARHLLRSRAAPSDVD